MEGGRTLRPEERDTGSGVARRRPRRRRDPLREGTPTPQSGRQPPASSARGRFRGPFPAPAYRPTVRPRRWASHRQSDGWPQRGTVARLWGFAVHWRRTSRFAGAIHPTVPSAGVPSRRDLDQRPLIELVKGQAHDGDTVARRGWLCLGRWPSISVVGAGPAALGTVKRP